MNLEFYKEAYGTVNFREREYLLLDEPHISGNILEVDPSPIYPCFKATAIPLDVAIAVEKYNCYESFSHYDCDIIWNIHPEHIDSSGNIKDNIPQSALCDWTQPTRMTVLDADRPKEWELALLLDEAKSPLIEQFNERLTAINNFDKTITSNSLPQDKFISYMKNYLQENKLWEFSAQHQRDYVADAATDLFLENIPKSQVKACIKNFAPEAVYDAAVQQVYNQVFGYASHSYVDSVATQAQNMANSIAKTRGKPSQL